MSQFIKGDGFFPVCICLIIGAEYPVDFTEEVPEQLAPLLRASLDDGNEVIQVDIYVGCGVRVLLLQELFPSGASLGHQRACVILRSGLCCLLQMIWVCYIFLGNLFFGEVGYRLS